MVLEIYEYDYDEEIYTSLSQSIEEIKESIETHLQNTVKGNTVIKNIQYDAFKMFVQNGIPYVSVYLKVTYLSEYYPHNTQGFEIWVETITGKQ